MRQLPSGTHRFVAWQPLQIEMEEEGPIALKIQDLSCHIAVRAVGKGQGIQRAWRVLHRLGISAGRGDRFAAGELPRP
jgi:hypothetical protein